MEKIVENNNEHTIEYYKERNQELEAKLKWYEEQFRLLQKQKYGVSSEKTNDDQMSLPLFNEAEDTADLNIEEPTLDTITYQRKKSRKTREELMENLPIETIEYELSPEEQVCSCCGNKTHKMSEEIRKELQVIPAQVKVVRHVRHVYACRQCEKDEIETPIVTAKMPLPVFPKSYASPSIIAYIMNQKYAEGLPLYRQESQLKYLGINLSRQTLANWMVEGANRWLSKIYDRMKYHLLQEDILHADETTVQVLREPGRSADSKSYMWLYRNGRDRPPNILFEYQRSRASKHPKRFLSEFKGYLHVDGYGGYDSLPNVTLSGCWSHARRKFDEALKSLPKEADKSKVTATEGLEYCNQLFAIERKCLDKTPKERYEIRIKRSQPILEAFSTWLKMQTPKVLPKSALGKAIKYCRNQWNKLTVFLEDGRLEIDNNRSERSIKPFVIGRKNFLFSNTPKGAESSAIIYSIVETAKENGLSPFEYLKYLFEQLPNIDSTNEEAMDQLLPWSTTIPLTVKVQIKS
ncbi:MULTISPECIES: IS66 family transposase [Bacillaceae]|uniref:Transposase n=6 Tax=Bacillales TaxID=1385 RepID=A0ABR5MEZ1_9BACI|nr:MULTISPECIES: IS66 family transposase [Bacillaceae]KPH68143.1 transposase [Oceanobacillus caeni]MBU8792546.1 IS66 family transposase [Oceanobacillus caeni]MED4475638.1 IS66 family transposase [Oceanobacillus caeni]